MEIDNAVEPNYNAEALKVEPITIEMLQPEDAAIDTTTADTATIASGNQLIVTTDAHVSSTANANGQSQAVHRANNPFSDAATVAPAQSVTNATDAMDDKALAVAIGIDPQSEACGAVDGVVGSNECNVIPENSSDNIDTPASQDAVSAHNSDGNDDSEEEEDYEALRRRNIEANNKMLAALGLFGDVNTSFAAVEEAPKKKKSKPKVKRNSSSNKEATELIPRRRSSRKIGLKPDATPISYVEVEEVPVIEEVHPIGKAFKSLATGGSSGRSTANASAKHLLDSGKCMLRTDHKHAIYSTAMLPELGVLAVAGGKGRITFFAADASSALAAPYLEAGTNNIMGPMLSTKAHKRWISEIRHVSSETSTSSLLLSASDDSSIVLSKLELGGGEDGAGSQLCPVARLDDAHTGGVFSLDEQRSEIVSCSKDSTVALSIAGEARLSTVRVYDEFASGVLKCVRWQPTSSNKLFAACGNDFAINLFDCRETKPVATVEDAHPCCINSLRFHPGNDHELISSGFDTRILVWDIRNFKTPVVELTGHHGKSNKVKSLLHPCYYNGQVLAPGENSPYLTLFDSATGTMNRQIYAGFASSSLFVHKDGKLTASQGQNWIWTFDAEFLAEETNA